MSMTGLEVSTEFQYVNQSPLSKALDDYADVCKRFPWTYDQDPTPQGSMAHMAALGTIDALITLLVTEAKLEGAEMLALSCRRPVRLREKKLPPTPG